ncbi:lactoylglutathione lyase [Fusarium phyllophilum]|uniref:Lactoylglutathione lyase n=1 Tax=Fusarium phyllophilum TaxID=47803 RepID=A0A8H5JSZ7_9HYPO|nr:lactoylglutathione lyase [Fusarium phyllophilum]
MVRFLSTLLLGAQLILSASSHSIPNMVPRSGQQEYPYPVLGSDDPADYATTGYFINHLAISTRNLTASLDFYSKVLGFRKMFTLHVSKKYGEKFTELTDDLVIGPAVGLPPAVVAQLSLEEREAIVQGLGPRVDPLIFIVDPDGNFIEIQGEEGADLVRG